MPSYSLTNDSFGPRSRSSGSTLVSSSVDSYWSCVESGWGPALSLQLSPTHCVMLARGSLLVGKGSERHRQENQREPTEEQEAPARTAREGKGEQSENHKRTGQQERTKKKGGEGGKRKREEGTPLTRLRPEAWEPSTLRNKPIIKKGWGGWQRNNGSPWGCGLEPMNSGKQRMNVRRAGHCYILRPIGELHQARTQFSSATEHKILLYSCYMTDNSWARSV